MEKEELFPVNEVVREDDLPKGFLEFFVPLHKRFSGWADICAARRVINIMCAHKVQLPNYTLDERKAAGEDGWKATLSEFCLDQRNQMTGPADDAELVVKMLNSGAPGVMIDFEDSMANTWPHLRIGVANAVAALHGELTYTDKKGQIVGIKESKTVLFTRVRGLHMRQLLFGVSVSAPLFDLSLLAYQVDAAKLKHPLCIYIPKSESASEAKWWSWLFKDVARAKGWPKDYIKCMALLEAHPLVYEMEDFILNLREHIMGLNLGRWDYMASLAHFNLRDPKWVLPDRNTIPHDVAFFQRLRELLVQVCHKRGILAIGGMTALYPSRSDAELNKRALEVLAKDKRNESEIGMDGAWTGHPDQNEIAVSAFPYPNQLFRTVGAERFPDLRPAPGEVGKITLSGTCIAVRTCILYRFGVLSGKGASLLAGYMEDLATDRIYRLMIAQRVRHGHHSEQEVKGIFARELQLILDALGTETSDEVRARYREASRLTQEMIVREQFNPY